MKRNKRKNNKALVLLLALVAFISVGYAAISTTLNINGTGTVGKPTWDIHFEDVEINEDSVATTDENKAKIVKDEKGEYTIVTYTIDLAEPGDFYEFTVNVVNKGTLTGELESINNVKGLTETQKAFVKYTVTYKDKDGNTVTEGSLLKKTEVNKVTVRVEFDKDIDKDVLDSIAELSEDDLKLDLSYQLNYGQA